MSKQYKIKLAILPGDGIGQEVILAAIPIFNALNLSCQLTYGEIGWSCWQKEGNPIPQKTWDIIQDADAILLGATTSKPEQEARKELNSSLINKQIKYNSPIIELRKRLDLFVNIRPCFSIKNQNFNFCIIRENTEGLYSGFDYHPIPEAIQQLIANNSQWNKNSAADLSCTLRLQSREGLTRLFNFAYKYAVQKGFHTVTLADKPNVLRSSSHFARKIFEKIGKNYPSITSEIANVDAIAMWIVRRPEQFGVIVAENMFGDILSDVAAGIMGGLGFAPSANLGYQHCYFEPVHGSGPMMKKNTANPSACFFSISMLLDHLGYHEEAKKIHNAVIKTVIENKVLTYDIGGKATTMEMAKRIIDQATKSR